MIVLPLFLFDLLQQETVELNATIVRANDELMRLKGAESGVKKQREKAMKDMESQMKASQRLATSLKQEVTALKSKKDSDSAEVVALQSELAALVEQLEICSNTIARLTKDGNTLFSQVWLTHTYVDILVAKLIFRCSFFLR